MCLLSSCRDVCVSPDLTFVNSKAFKDTTFRDELRECYRYRREWVFGQKGWNMIAGPKIFLLFTIPTDLMLMRYWARATDSQLPLMVIVRSRLAGASLSSQFEIRIIAPLICLRWEMFYYYFYNWSGFDMLNNAMSARSQESNLLDYFKLMRACVALLVNVCPALLDMSVTNHSNVHGCRR